tara:strand:- start:5534 stop:5791 length:258 start_codon:yes stop_codon:yes gene_type:complete
MRNEKLKNIMASIKAARRDISQADNSISQALESLDGAIFALNEIDTLAAYDLAEGLENVIHELQGVEYMLSDYASPENMVLGGTS